MNQTNLQVHHSGVSSVLADSIKNPPAVQISRRAIAPNPQSLASSTRCMFFQSTTQPPSQLAKSHKTRQPATPRRESSYPNSCLRLSGLQLAILGKAMAMGHRLPFSTSQLRPRRTTIERATKGIRSPETLRKRPQLAERARLTECR